MWRKNVLPTTVLATFVIKHTDHLVTRICHLCDHTLLGIEDMKNHLANHHYAYSFYSCNMCNTTSSSLQTFNKHLNSEHDIADAAPCLTCDKVFLNEEELQSHVITIHVLDIASPCMCLFKLPFVLTNNHNGDHHEQFMDLEIS